MGRVEAPFARALGAFALLAIVLGTAPRAHAQHTEAQHTTATDEQSADPSARAEARTLFERATAALAGGQPAEGRDLLRRSLSLYATIPTAFNLAIALRRTGDTSESLALLEALLEGTHGDISEVQRSVMQAQLEEARQELGSLRVEVLGVDSAEVEVDGRPVGTFEGPHLLVPVDAGRHVVTAHGGGGDARAPVEVRRGQSLDVSLTIAVSTDEHPDRGEAARGGGLSPWLWVGGGALLAAAGVVVAILLLSGQRADPIPGDIDGVVETLRW